MAFASHTRVSKRSSKLQAVAGCISRSCSMLFHVGSTGTCYSLTWLFHSHSSVDPCTCETKSSECFVRARCTSSMQSNGHTRTASVQAKEHGHSLVFSQATALHGSCCAPTCTSVATSVTMRDPKRSGRVPGAWSRFSCSKCACVVGDMGVPSASCSVEDFLWIML